MDLEENHFDEVYKILFSNPFGLEFQALYQKCKSFPEAVDLSRCLHRASQQGNVFKQTGIYKLTTEKYKEMSGGKEPPIEEEKSDPITEAIKELVAKDTSIPKLPEQQHAEAKPEPHRIVRSTIQRTQVKSISGKQDIKAMAFGGLQRTKTMGGTALALYKARDSAAGLTMEDLIEWTGCDKTCLYQVLPKLIERRYIVRDGVPRSRSVRYRWSGNFRYPFISWEKEDEEFLKYSTLLDFENRGDRTARAITVPPDQVEIVQEHESGEMATTVAVSSASKQYDLPTLSTSHALLDPRLHASPAAARVFIDLQLKSLQAQMDVLQHMREHLFADA